MYARVNDARDEVESQFGRPLAAGIGPPPPPPPVEEGINYHLLTEPIDWSGRPSDTAIMRWNGGAYGWQEAATLDQLRAARADAISAACRAHIEQGFLCAALDSPHTYPAKQQDQANLIGSVTDSLLFADDPDWITPFWCADADGAWEFRLHTRAQIQQVGRAGKASILAAMQKNELLQRQILAADAAQLAAIVW